jgi:DNA-binding NtrC family response regulator
VLTQVLVVAHERPERVTLTSMLSDLGVPSVIDADCPEHALSALEHGVDAAFLFASMPNGHALHVARSAARTCPSPPVIIVSEGPHPDLFALAQAGARSLLVWPLTSEEVRRCLEVESPATDPLENCVRSLVGRVGIKDAQGWVRSTMLQHALDASHGSRRRAARLLGVTRPAIQRMLKQGDPGLSVGCPSILPVPLRKSAVHPLGTVRAGPGTSRKRRAY